MKRVIAVLAAAAMITLALVIRGAISANGGDDTADNPRDGAGEGLTIICGPELLAACNTIAEDLEGVSVSQMDEWATAEALITGETELTANRVWLAAGNWPAIAAAGQTGAVAGATTNISEIVSSEVLARSPAVMIGRTDQMEAAGTACGTVDWSCVGSAAGKQWTALGGQDTWGRVKIALPDVAAGPGMVSVNQSVASQVGTSNFATNDLDEPGVTAWFDHLAESSAANSGSTTPLVEFISRPNQLSIVGALESDAMQELEGTARAGSLTVVAPEPVASADVQLWAPDDASLKNAIDELGEERLRKALAATGWRTPKGADGSEDLSAPSEAGSIDADMASLDTPLPEIGAPGNSGLPSPGTIFTVNDRWRRAR